MVRAADHAEDVQDVRVAVGHVDAHRGALVLRDVVHLRSRRPHGPDLCAVGPERARARARLLVFAVHHHRIVGRGHGVPHRPRRPPPAELHRRVAKVRQQVEALGEQAEVQSVAVAVRAVRIVVQPHRAGVLAGPRPQNRQPPLLLVHAAQPRRHPLPFDHLRHRLLESLRVLGKQVVRQARHLRIVRAVQHLRKRRVARQLIQPPQECKPRRLQRHRTAEIHADVLRDLLGEAARVSDQRVVAIQADRVHVEPPGLVQLRMAAQHLRQKSRVHPRVPAEQLPQRPRTDRRVPRKPFLAGQPVHRRARLDDRVDQPVHLVAVGRPIEHRPHDHLRHLRARPVRLDLGQVGQRVAQDALLDVAADVGQRRLGVLQAEGPRLAAQKGHQLVVVAQTIGHLVVRQGQLADLLAGIVPGRDVTAARRAFVHHPFSGKVERRVKVGHTVQQHTRLMGIARLARDHVRRRQVPDPRHNRLLPLPVDQVRSDESPAFLAIDVALTVIHAERVPRVRRVRMLGIEQQPAVRPLRVEDALLVQARTVEGVKIVLGKQLLAVRAAHLPRLLEGLDLPVVHGHAFQAGRAVPVRPDHPRPLDRVAEHQVPQLVVGERQPRLGRFDQPIAGLGRPRVLGNVPPRLRHHRPRQKLAPLGTVPISPGTVPISPGTVPISPGGRHSPHFVRGHDGSKRRRNGDCPLRRRCANGHPSPNRRPSRKSPIPHRLLPNGRPAQEGQRTPSPNGSINAVLPRGQPHKSAGWAVGRGRMTLGALCWIRLARTAPYRDYAEPRP